jgi:ABC-2 type transport system ATP-binding protein
MTAIVRTRAVVKRFGSVVALDGIDLEVAAGASVGLSGANGSGRTTLLQVLAMLRSPTAGEVEIAGVDARRFPLEARTFAMYVGQELYAANAMTVKEYLGYVRTARRSRGTTDSATTVDAAIERAELPADMRTDRLSTGTRKQVALAAALLVAPRLLLLDDPLASLDAVARGRFVAWIAEVRSSGTVLIAAVNNADDSQALCETVLRMERGRIVSGSTGVGLERRPHLAPAHTAGRA